MAAVAVAAALGTGWHHRRFLELFRHLPHYVALGFSVPLLLLLNLPSQEFRREGWTERCSAVRFCLGSGLFGSYNSD